MKKFIYSLLFVFTYQFCLGQPTVYSFQIDSVSGSNPINFSTFQGKKIVIVNTATSDSNSYQFSELEQLYQLYKDSIVVIAISSNSFNTEPRTNSEIGSFCTSTYDVHFPISTKILVRGNNADTLYKWLTQKNLNMILNSSVNGAFQKFLINKQGKLVGVFGRKTKPMSETFRHAIEVL